jgi:hypothetical protein
MYLAQLVSQEPTEVPTSARRPVPWREQIPAPIKFAVSLKAPVDKISDACPSRGHRDHAESFEDENETKE